MHAKYRKRPLFSACQKLKKRRPIQEEFRGRSTLLIILHRQLGKRRLVYLIALSKHGLWDAWRSSPHDGSASMFVERLVRTATLSEA